MIKSWKHSGLEVFFKTGKTVAILNNHAKKLKIILQLLNAADKPERLDFPGMRFHQLKGDKKGYFSVTVSANWRVIYKFDGEDAILVDYLDYH